MVYPIGDGNSELKFFNMLFLIINLMVYPIGDGNFGGRFAPRR